MWIRGALSEACMNYGPEERIILQQILKEHPQWELDGFLLADEVKRRQEKSGRIQV